MRDEKIQKIYKIIDEMTCDYEIESICCNEREYLNGWKGVLKRRIRNIVKE